MDHRCSRTVLATLSIVAFILTAGSAALAAPTMDGKFDPGEGYTSHFELDLQLERGGPLLPGAGDLWVYEDAGTGNVSAAFIQPVTLVDNTYGANSIGWGSSAPSGKSHNFGDLTGSDKAEFQFTDGSDAVVLNVVLDYLTQSGSVYRSLGVTGGDGDVNTGSASDVLDWGTSLEYDFETVDSDNNNFTSNSPLSAPDYSDPASAPGWIFEVIYEIQVDGALFAANGFGGVSVPIVHDSPNKQGKNKVYPENPTLQGQPAPYGAVPEPASIVLFGLGGLGMALRRRRSKKQAA